MTNSHLKDFKNQFEFSYHRLIKILILDVLNGVEHK